MRSKMVAAFLWSSALSTVSKMADEWIYCRLIILCVFCYLFFKKDYVELFQTLLTLILYRVTANMWNRDIENPPDDRAKTIKKKESPVVFQPPKKSSRRDKKKKRSYSPKEGEGSSKLTKGPHLEKTKVYQQLQEFTFLKMDASEVYKYFVPYLLTKEALEVNGFPIESPEVPGQIVRKKLPAVEDRSLRYCVRCGTKFHIVDGEYHSETTCLHHPKKITSYLGVPGAGEYLCCKGDYKSKGCKQSSYHVSAQQFLDGVSFSRIREKRHVRGGQSCAVYALDCEMSYTTGGLEVTKVGLVGVEGLTIYETFVKPYNKILDHNTLYSGVTAKDLEGVTTRIADVQEFLLKLLNKDSILVGHAVHNDLLALRLIHERVVDTSVVFPDKRGARFKRSLKSLAKEHLNADIQTGAGGHDCIDDARACMALMLSKINSDFDYPISTCNNENKNSYLLNKMVDSQSVDYRHYTQFQTVQFLPARSRIQTVPMFTFY